MTNEQLLQAKASISAILDRLPRLVLDEEGRLGHLRKSEGLNGATVVDFDLGSVLDAQRRCRADAHILGEILDGEQPVRRGRPSATPNGQTEPSEPEPTVA